MYRSVLWRFTISSLFFVSGMLNSSALSQKELDQNALSVPTSTTEVSAHRKYFTFNYPSPIPGGNTLLTGIRGVKDDPGQVLISGFYECPNNTCVTSFVYKGKFTEPGHWFNLNYPSSPGITVTATNLYGPNNGPKHDIQVVGNYTTAETGASTIGCLYEGPLDGTGTWTTLVPTSDEPVLNTIAHSTMGCLAVGNYDTEAHQSKAFIYDICNKKYHDIIRPNSNSITAYGIWHNGKNSYTIAGGYSNADAALGVGTAYLVDWNRKTKKFSNWRSYSYDNDPIKAIETHFDGITSDGHGGYNLTGDWVGVADGPELGFFAHVKGNQKATWSPISYPGPNVTSGNSVYQKIVIGVYTSLGNPINGFVSFP